MTEIDFLQNTTPPFSVEAETRLREALKRCSPLTRDAACQFRRSGNFELLPAIVRGVIERFIESDRRERLHATAPTVRLIEDLGIDSLTMMEIVMLAEEALPITISNEELRHLRTIGEVEQFIASKLRGERPPPGSGTGDCFLSDVNRRPANADCSATTPSNHPAA